MFKIGAIGNRYMKDDGIAIKILESIEEKIRSPEVDIIFGETDSQSFFYQLDEEDYIIILDAQYVGVEPGSIQVFNLQEVLEQPSGYLMQHDMSIIELMKLYGKSYKGTIIGIEIAEIEPGEELSPILKEKFPALCSKVQIFLKNLISEEIQYA